jgi:hypothetical protein
MFRFAAVEAPGYSFERGVASTMWRSEMSTKVMTTPSIF